MAKKDLQQPTNRRGFIGTLATGAAALGMTTLAAPLSAYAEKEMAPFDGADPEAWFNQIKGKHKVVFDVPEVHGIFPFAWPRIFLVTNQATGTPEKDNSVVV